MLMEKTMNNIYIKNKLNRADVLVADFYTIFRRNQGMLSFIILLTVLGLCGLLSSLLGWLAPSGTLLLGSLLALVYGPLLFLLSELNMNKYLKKNPSYLNKPHEYLFTGEGIKYKNAVGEFVEYVAWNEVDSLHTTKKYHLLYTSKRSMLILRRPELPPHTENAFLNLCAAKIPPQANIVTKFMLPTKLLQTLLNKKTPKSGTEPD